MILSSIVSSSKVLTIKNILCEGIFSGGLQCCARLFLLESECFQLNPAGKTKFLRRKYYPQKVLMRSMAKKGGDFLRKSYSGIWFCRKDSICSL
jgi:hypothetical protein